MSFLKTSVCLKTHTKILRVYLRIKYTNKKRTAIIQFDDFYLDV